MLFLGLLLLTASFAATTTIYLLLYRRVESELSERLRDWPSLPGLSSEELEKLRQILAQGEGRGGTEELALELRRLRLEAERILDELGTGEEG